MERFEFGSSPGLDAPAHRAVTAAMAVAVPRASLVLSAMVRRPVAGQAGETQSVTLADLDGPDSCWFRLEHPEPSAVCTPGVALLSNLSAVALADVLMGGPGFGAEREPTPLECRLVADALTRALAPVGDSLAQFGVAVGLTSATRDDITLDGALVRLSIVLSVSGLELELVLAYPASVFAAGDRRAETMQVTPEMAATLRSVPVTVAVRFAPLTVSADDIGELAVGDVIRLDHQVGRPLVGEVDGKELFLAQPGQSGRAVAVEVLDVLEETY
jgi:flagellar motor switch protein FliM